MKLVDSCINELGEGGKFGWVHGFSMIISIWCDSGTGTLSMERERDQLYSLQRVLIQFHSGATCS